MENNKILICVRFVSDNSKNEYEFYVLRDIKVRRLIVSIYQLMAGKSVEPEICKECMDREFSSDVPMSESNSAARIMFTSFRQEVLNSHKRSGNICMLRPEDLDKCICDLGIITSSYVIFTNNGFTDSDIGKRINLQDFTIQEVHANNTVHQICAAFNPISEETIGERISYPEYNISTRQLTKLDDTPIEIIPPSEPPVVHETGLFSLLLPSLIGTGSMLLFRAMNAQNWLMLAATVAMAGGSAYCTYNNWARQKQEYQKDLDNWRERYQDYINNLIGNIRTRQDRDAGELRKQYPEIKDILSLISKLDSTMYSRSVNDHDFLSFRLGTSDQVPNIFPIHGELKDTVFSTSYFSRGSDCVQLLLGSELQSGGAGDVHPLCQLPSVIANDYRFMRGAPLLYPLSKKYALGIVGGSGDNDSEPNNAPPGAIARVLVEQMILELSFYHSPDQLQFVVFFDKSTSQATIEETINRYKFLPHFRGLFADKSQFVFGTKSADLVMNNLLAIMSERQRAGADAVSMPHTVLIVYDQHNMKEHAFAQYLPTVPAKPDVIDNLGLTFVFVSEHREYLPPYCDDVIDQLKGSISEGARIEGVLTPHADANGCQKFWCTIENRQTTQEKMHFLSSVYYAGIAQNVDLPSSFSMFDLLDCYNKPVDALQKSIAESWKSSTAAVSDSLSVEIGISKTAKTTLDLHEKADGPHMLVAGTTGSGKSEAIISFLVSLCKKFRPDQVNLLLVDMKGGGFTKRLGHLPHVVGHVTDIDGNESDTSDVYVLTRFLNAMQYELKRRKMLLNKMHVDSADDYIRACVNIEAHIALLKTKGSQSSDGGISDDEAAELRNLAATDRLTHLILVVDEFTELKRFTLENDEVDFISEITTIARVGRSLGVHIILISQNIEGAITDDIRVNTNARLCLKVASAQASKEMLGIDLAGLPTMPSRGRAYLMVGSGARLEYFQSAYSGGSTNNEDQVEFIEASRTGLYLSRSVTGTLSDQEASGPALTQLDVLTAAICKAYETYKDSRSRKNEALYPVHQVFRAPLPNCVAMDQDGRIYAIEPDGTRQAINID